jgi:hypothetical protein
MTPLIKEALFEVKIKGEKLNIHHKNINYDEARKLVDDCLSKSEDDPKLQEIIKDLGYGNSFGFSSRYSSGTEVSISAYLPRTKNIGPKHWCSDKSKSGEPFADWDIIGKDKVCNCCGSLHPDDMINLIKEKGFGIIGTTDKSYKWYINRPEIINAGFGAIKFYLYHFEQSHIDQYNDMLAKRNNDQSISSSVND